MNTNTSNVANDERVINQVIFEKSLLGAIPKYFRVEGDPRLHPVKWYTHPHLTEVVFSDGTTSHVQALKPTEELASAVGAVPIQEAQEVDAEGYYTHAGADSARTEESDVDDVNGGEEAESETYQPPQISTQALAQLFAHTDNGDETQKG